MIDSWDWLMIGRGHVSALPRNHGSTSWWHHRCKMAAFSTQDILASFLIVGGSGDASSIFICSLCWWQPQVDTGNSPLTCLLCVMILKEFNIHPRPFVTVRSLCNSQQSRTLTSISNCCQRPLELHSIDFTFLKTHAIKHTKPLMTATPKNVHQRVRAPSSLLHPSLSLLSVAF